MKRGLIVVTGFLIALLILPLISAEILLKDPEATYGKGEALIIPTTITTNTGISDFFQMFLICNGQEKEFYKEYIILTPGQEKKISPAILLITESIENFNGNCVVKATLAEESVLTSDFTISTEIFTTTEIETTELNPGDKLIINGISERADQSFVNGFAELKISELGIESITTIKDGRFYIEESIADDAKAGDYIGQILTYEKDKNDVITNQGTSEIQIKINQISTEIEIEMITESVNPGEPITFKVFLYDQTEQEIPTEVISTIRNNQGQIVEQFEHQTLEEYQYNTKKDSPFGNWSVHSEYEDLEMEAEFEMEKNAEVSFTLVNQTLTITNIGNVQYNNTILITIGNVSENVFVNLALGESIDYTLRAEDGVYKIVISDGKNSLEEENVVLTGKSVSIKESSGLFGSSIIPWIFIILVFGFTIFLIYSKGYKGKISLRRTSQSLIQETKPVKKAKVTDHELFGKLDKVELSLNIQGEKQEASVVCLKIKNLDEIKQEKSNVKDTMKEIINYAERHKALPYLNNDYLFFIFATIITKSFKNEREIIDVAQHTVQSIENHNKMFKQKINFGVSANHGNIIAQKEKETGNLHFSSIGNFIGLSKKLAELANREIYLSQKVNDKMLSQVKTEKVKRTDVEAYKIQKIVERTEEHKKFISKFLKSIEDEKSRKS